MKLQVKKALWFTAGIIFLGIAYIGVITPGIPWSTPSLAAAYCFARSNERWHNWMINHKLFGAFLRNWQEHRVFPTRAKWAMFVSMDISLLIVWFTTYNIWLTVVLGSVMAVVAIWAWRYPGNKQTAEERKAQGQPLGWF